MNFRTIELTNGMFAIVDEKHFEDLNKFKWSARKWHRSYYARTFVVRKGKKKSLSMHRMIAKTPSGQVCHHKNFNSLDNREENLENLSGKKHNDYHCGNHLKIIFEKNSGKTAL